VEFEAESIAQPEVWKFLVCVLTHPGIPFDVGLGLGATQLSSISTSTALP